AGAFDNGHCAAVAANRNGRGNDSFSGLAAGTECGMKLAVFLPNWVGDAVMATPALRGLRTQFADAEIIGVMSPVIADVLQGLDVMDRVILHQSRGKDPDCRDGAIIHRLREARCELGVLLPNSWRSAWIAWRAGIRRRVGFHRDGRGILLTD